MTKLLGMQNLALGGARGGGGWAEGWFGHWCTWPFYVGSSIFWVMVFGAPKVEAGETPFGRTLKN